MYIFSLNPVIGNCGQKGISFRYLSTKSTALDGSVCGRDPIQLGEQFHSTLIEITTSIIILLSQMQFFRNISALVCGMKSAEEYCSKNELDDDKST